MFGCRDGALPRGRDGAGQGKGAAKGVCFKKGASAAAHKGHRPEKAAPRPLIKYTLHPCPRASPLTAKGLLCPFSKKEKRGESHAFSGPLLRRATERFLPAQWRTSLLCLLAQRPSFGYNESLVSNAARTRGRAAGERGGRTVMLLHTFEAEGKSVCLFPGRQPDAPVLYLNTFPGEGERVLRALRETGCADFSLVAVSNLDWNCDMAPWDAPPAFARSGPFTGGAQEYLGLLTQNHPPRGRAACQRAAMAGDCRLFHGGAVCRLRPVRSRRLFPRGQRVRLAVVSRHEGIRPVAWPMPSAAAHLLFAGEQGEQNAKSHAAARGPKHAGNRGLLSGAGGGHAV